MAMRLHIKKDAKSRMVSKLIVVALAIIVVFFAQPALSASPSAANTTSYDIPLSELKRVVKKQPAIKKVARVVKTKDNRHKVPPKQRVLPVDSVSLATLESVRVIEEGIRLDIDELSQKIRLLLEPGNKKVVLQLPGVSYPTGSMNVPLDKSGFIKARMGRHTEGIWVVFESTDSTLPLFDVIQDSEGIILKTTATNKTPESPDFDGQSVLLAREALGSANIHVLTPDISIDQPDFVISEDVKQTSSSLVAYLRKASLQSDKAAFARISHTPFSFVVAGKQTIIQAVISGINDIKDAYCVVRTAAKRKPIIVPMTKITGTLYTYQAELPATNPASKFIYYSIITLDSLGKKTNSDEFMMPVTSSPVVPKWQQ